MPAIHPDDAQVQPRPVYLYIIQHIDHPSITPIFLTDREGDVVVDTLPATYGGSDPQTFTYGRIGHGRINREGTFDKSTFEVQVRTKESGGLSRYALTGAVPRIKVTIVRANPEPVDAGESVEWGTETLIVQSGLMTTFSFEGHNVAAECVPEPLISNFEVPRWRFSRTCNHQLYSPTIYTVAITGITSTASDFTVTAPGHAFVAGDLIRVAAATPGGYNGNWTVDSVSGDDVTVLDTANLGAGSGGTIGKVRPGCTLIANDYVYSTSILALDPVNRQLTVSGTDPSETGNYFRQGSLSHNPTGVRLSIFASSISGTDTLIRLNNWSPDLAVSDGVQLYPGCDHRLATCRDKFANAQNFGGFATIPNKNPSLHAI